MKNNSHNSLQIKRRGEDGNKIITIRIKEALLTKIDDAAKEINCSRNELINLLLEHSIDSIEIV